MFRGILNDTITCMYECMHKLKRKELLYLDASGFLPSSISVYLRGVLLYSGSNKHDEFALMTKLPWFWPAADGSFLPVYHCSHPSRPAQAAGGTCRARLQNLDRSDSRPCEIFKTIFCRSSRTAERKRNLWLWERLWLRRGIIDECERKFGKRLERRRLLGSCKTSEWTVGTSQ